MPQPILTPKGSAPARLAELPTARRRSLVIALMIVAVFFGGSMVLVYRLTGRPAPVASPRPSLDTGFRASAPDPPTAPRPAAVAAPSSGRPAPGLVAWPPLPSAAAPVSTAASSIEVSFKLDPRLTRGLGMGDRWVSPPTYTSAALTGTDVTIEARARARDSSGRPMKDVTPVWTPADAGMVAVAPAERGAVRITVKRAGRSDVTVTSGRAAKKLTVAAVQERGVWRVDIAQR